MAAGAPNFFGKGLQSLLTHAESQWDSGADISAALLKDTYINNATNRGTFETWSELSATEQSGGTNAGPIDVPSPTVTRSDAALLPVTIRSSDLDWGSSVTCTDVKYVVTVFDNVTIEAGAQLIWVVDLVTGGSGVITITAGVLKLSMASGGWISFDE